MERHHLPGRPDKKQKTYRRRRGMESLEPILAEHPFFKGLKQRYLQLIVGCASNVRFNAGEFIFREGEEANLFYLIRHGNVALEIAAPERDPMTIQTVGEGDILGWSWLIPPYHWLFDARAIELTRALALDGKCLRTKCEEDHDLGYELLKRFAHIMDLRLQATRLQLLDVYGKHS
jgi:CRP/FNR family cyclic AMP-dependent transcriptional regulator